MSVLKLHDDLKILSGTNLMVDLPPKWKCFALIQPSDASPVAVVQLPVANEWIYTEVITHQSSFDDGDYVIIQLTSQNRKWFLRDSPELSNIFYSQIHYNNKDEKKITTAHPDILLAKSRELDFLKIKNMIHKMDELLIANREKDAISELKKLVPEFSIDPKNKIY